METKTKIVATVGPACQDAAVIEEMAQAGAGVFRINFSHGDEATRTASLETVRQVEARLGVPLCVMADLCGPKIRVGMIAEGACILETGARVEIRRDPVEGTPAAISTTLAELVDYVETGQVLLLDEGSIRLRVVEADPPARIGCEVLRGGVLKSGKGVHLPETDLRLPALTEKDLNDVDWIVQRDFDLVALSFVQRGEDIAALRSLLPPELKIIAKIEKPQALARIDAIVGAADGIMIARGDLGVEMDLSQVPVAQKQLARLARERCKVCVVATQMLESMTRHPMPTRAEATDIANAVLDGADALMLSGETAVGMHPVAAVATMKHIAQAAEAYEAEHRTAVRVDYAPARTTAALAAAVWAVVEREDIAAAVVYTATGTTANVLAKQRLNIPILAMSPSRHVVRQMGLLYGVLPAHEPIPEHTRDVLAKGAAHLKARGLVRAGEKIVALSGRPIGQPGATNNLVVYTLT